VEGDVISMGPELIAGTAAILAAAITAGPAYMAARKSGRTATEEGTATREAIAALHARVDAVASEVYLLRGEVSAVREMQVAHIVDHALTRD